MRSLNHYIFFVGLEKSYLIDRCITGRRRYGEPVRQGGTNFHTDSERGDFSTNSATGVLSYLDETVRALWLQNCETFRWFQDFHSQKVPLHMRKVGYGGPFGPILKCPNIYTWDSAD